ncbi:MAG TPA: hypothetical protein VEP90_09635 [Methylomirabilota bacterium]|nr:hypothetical protein [Methylomirabilota bacterium]
MWVTINTYDKAIQKISELTKERDAALAEAEKYKTELKSLGRFITPPEEQK